MCYDLIMRFTAAAAAAAAINHSAFHSVQDLDYQKEKENFNSLMTKITFAKSLH